MVKNTRVVFCPNCSDWIWDKEAIFDEGWSLLDEVGFLRQDVSVRGGKFTYVWKKHTKKTLKLTENRL